MKIGKSATLLCLLGALTGAGHLAAQGGPTTFQFSFSNPGARSLGLGGAFVALADDATAAFANPAGLIQLINPEVSLEGRYWSYSTPFTQGGRVFGEPTGIGLDGSIRIVDSEVDASALSFVSVVYPGRAWTLALDRHQLAEFEATSETQGLFTSDSEDDPQPTCLAGTEICRYPDFRRHTEIEIVSTTASFAYRISDSFSLGIGVSHFQGDNLIVSEEYLLTNDSLSQGFFGPNSYPAESRLGASVIEGEDTDWGLNLGFLWLLSRQWSIGGVYRAGPQFTLSGAEISGPALDPPIQVGTIGVSEPAIPIGFPDVLGLGLVYRSKNGSWTWSFEWDRVEYSTILESLPDNEIVSAVTVRLDDADELRLGGEYAFRQLTPLIAFRGGVWLDPDHQIRSIEDDPLERALLRAGNDELHYSLGIGIVFKNLQADLAVDFSDLVDTAAISLIYQF